MGVPKTTGATAGEPPGTVVTRVVAPPAAAPMIAAAAMHVASSFWGTTVLSIGPIQVSG